MPRFVYNTHFTKQYYFRLIKQIFLNIAIIKVIKKGYIKLKIQLNQEIIFYTSRFSG